MCENKCFLCEIIKKTFDKKKLSVLFIKKYIKLKIYLSSVATATWSSSAAIAAASARIPGP